MTTWYLVLAALFVIANGYFVAAEFAIVKVRSTQLAEAASRGDVRARMALRLTRHLDAYLSATQLGITLASLALGWVGEPAFAHLIEPWFVRTGHFSSAIAHSISATLAFAIISVLHIVFGELAPKSIAIRKPVETSLWISHILYFFYLVMFPAIWLLNGMSNLVLRLVGIQPVGEGEVAHSEEELRLILSHSEKAGVLSEPNLEMIEGIFQFSRRTAKQIMVPRTDVAILSTRRSVSENLEVIRVTGHTRYPLCDGSLDHTVGYIHVKDLFLAQLRGPGRPLTELKREVFYVPENTTVENLLNQFLAGTSHLAVVIDEYGGASGIVFMENITEELFGQIQDEFDRERPEVEPLGDGTYRVRGDYLIEDLVDRLGIDVELPAEKTIGGYVVARLAREVEAGDRVSLGPLSIEVIEGERFRVRWTLVRKRSQAEDESER
ncbi:MAG TPA: hemolysin family protein [Thermoanaerobaculia bacterium]|nr:hemolysin family protein [Thermoanaerobaculia bacterium]